MARRIEIEFDLPDVAELGSTIHRIRNFGEELYREFARSGQAKIKLAEIGRAMNRFCITGVKARQVKRVSDLVQTMLERHHLGDIAKAHIVPSD
jgi:hypothetical protein